MNFITIYNYAHIIYFMIFLSLLLVIIRGIYDFYLNKQKTKRQRQNLFMYSAQKLSARLEKRFSKAPLRKKQRYEIMLRQAGFNSKTYEQIIVIRISFLVVGFIVGMSLLKSPVMAFMLALIGYVGSWEYVRFARNKRIEKMDIQVGPFINILTERFISTGDMIQALKDCLQEFENIEPMYSEIKKAYLTVSTGGDSIEKTLESLSIRTGNIYMKNFARYYSITKSIGTTDAKKDLLPQAFKQYETNRKMKVLLKREISEPIRTAYMMVGAVVAVLFYQASTSEDYWGILTKTWYGNAILIYSCFVVLISVWIINVKLAASIDKREISENKKQRS